MGTPGSCRLATNPTLTFGCTFELAQVLNMIWPCAGTLDDVPVEGLTKGDYKLWPLWIWIYCIIAWFIQASAAALARRSNGCP